MLNAGEIDDAVIAGLIVLVLSGGLSWVVANWQARVRADESLQRLQDDTVRLKRQIQSSADGMTDLIEMLGKAKVIDLEHYAILMAMFKTTWPDE